MFKLIRMLDAGQRRFGYEHLFMHTGQHFDYELDGVFYRQLGVRRPDHNFNVGRTLRKRGGPTTHAYQTALLFERTAQMLERYHPDAVMYLGDTNSVLSSVVVSRYGVPVIHLEAGGRSYDWRMPEEKNRITIDHLSDVLYSYVPRYRDILISEGVEPFRITVIGNIIHDAIDKFLPLANKQPIHRKLKVGLGTYALVTLHREENTSTENDLGPKIAGLIRLAKEMPVVFPIMPRVKKNLIRFGLMRYLVASKVIRTKPLGFLEFLKLEKDARLTISDSGTVQEESLILGVPNVTTRLSTERPETIAAGATILDKVDLYLAAKRAVRLPRTWNRYVLNPTRRSPSEMAFVDLTTKIQSGFFTHSRLYPFLHRSRFVREAYGRIVRSHRR